MGLRLGYMGVLGLSCVLAAARPVAAGGSCDAATQVRLDFLESRLDAVYKQTRWWWRGWLAVFSIGVLYETEEGLTAHDHGKEADAWFSVAESLGGIADLVLTDRPALRRRQSAHNLANDSDEDCAKRLAEAERNLSEAAQAAGDRFGWVTHVITLGVSALHGGLIAGVWGDHARGAESFAITEAVGEAQIWTEPWRARQDWRDYRSAFEGHSTSRNRGRGWQLIAGPARIGFRYAF